MGKKYMQGHFTPEHPEKYIGSGSIIFRSSWELSMMRFLDKNPNVLQWASESIKIPYRNPFTGKQTVYVPDFFMVYQDKDGNKHTEIVEVKPRKETIISEAKSPRDKAAVALNMHKWTAAKAFCDRHGIVFRILNEQDIFTGVR